ncbi:beta-mannosidase [Agromyces flavus]|uniref:beta-mannosidase n=1 Tax=Agromyces flavus TaxID=589382 RepID=A0A1H1Z4Z3_9MICO|nr:sugar-binding domain-containing protein [Agromyces flavus]MCP2366928.1 beta-mannosidase [Agromyces flavus]GGI46742.1 beta-mannosidase [Agromyces flavus]SDT28738.1 beta-mannosidase [Agromyces flavus]
MKRPLRSGWRLTASDGPVPDSLRGVVVPGTVPGVVHTDLLAAGLIPDPYIDDNEALLSWIGLVDWTYETTIEIAPEELAAADRHDLAFDGLDTVATITLNGVVVGEVANQHRSYRYDVTDVLRAGENALVVAFRSPVRYANDQSVALGARPHGYPLPYQAIRKSACNFGWDWGIATFTSGLWRPARLESWSTARLAQVLVHASPAETGDGGVIEATVRVERASDDDLHLELDVAGVRSDVTIPAGTDEARLRVELESVERWWPAGYGEQPLSDVRIRLGAGGGVLDEVRRRVGFRTIRWDTEPDAGGTPFQLIVNDVPVFVKGANWIPDDALPVRVDRARYARRLRQARAANLNLIRVWGGGIYESDDFYELCDELGLLTWQDFLFACAAYPEEEPLRSEVDAEARDTVARIAHHASLVLLTGNNENLWGHEDWGWQPLLDGRTWGAWYYDELLPSVVDELAPFVPYSPGSPFSPGGEHPNAEDHGTMHIWDLWNQKDWRHYRDYRPRFVAEFGWQGPPAWTTLTRSISDEPITPESPGMLVHQKAVEGNTKLASGLVRHYRVPDDMEDWHWAMQLNQADAIACALDWFRANAPHTSGAVVWQLNDCWPVTSWAAIDGEEREKPVFHAIRNAFAPRVVTIQPAADGLIAVLGNDTSEAWSADLALTRRSFGGTVLGSATFSVEVAPRSNAAVTVPAALATARDRASELVVAEADDVRGFWFFAEPRDSALAAPLLTAEVRRDGDVFAVTVTTDALVRGLTLLVDKLAPDATVDTALVTLLPGEHATFRVGGLAALEPADVLAPTVLRHGNQLVA